MRLPIGVFPKRRDLHICRYGRWIDALSKALDRKLVAHRQVVVYDIPLTDGAALAWLYKNGDVISTEPQDMSSIVKVALQVPDVGRFARRFSLEPLQ